MFGKIQDTLFLYVKGNSMNRAFCFDLDGTITQEEILPEIARNVGIHEEIEILTKITMQGLMTFDKSMKLRVKLLSTIPISDVQKVVSGIKINKDIQNFIKENKENCFIVTGNLDVWVKDFIETNFGCDFFSSQADYKNDMLIGINNIIQKSSAVKSLNDRFDSIVTIGDGMNDCSMFEAGDIGIAYGGVHPPVPTLIKLSDYVCYDGGTLVNLLNALNRNTDES